MSWSPNPLPPNWPTLVNQVLTRDNHTCYIGGCKASEVDHVIPRSEGGTDNPSNLRAICNYHHRRKTAQEANRARKRKYDRRRPTEPHPGLIDLSDPDDPPTEGGGGDPPTTPTKD